jgi:glycosyltransferase involved in cell wall biosynthesis
MRRLGVDVVNAHAPVPGLGDLAVLISGRPAVMTYHAGSMIKGHRFRDRVLGLYERLVLPRVFARTRAVVAVSPTSLAFGRPGTVEITPGVDVDRFTAGLPASTRPHTIVYVGRLDRASSWKGVDVLLRGFAALADLPDARLKLVGGGNAIPDHVELAERLGIAGRVEFTGELRGDALIAAMQSAAVLVLPSLTEAESFGIVLVEAMACGTPVVASRTTSLPEVLGDAAVLVDPHALDELTSAIERVCTDVALRCTLVERGRRRAAEFRWDRTAREALKIYADAA